MNIMHDPFRMPTTWTWLAVAFLSLPLYTSRAYADVPPQRSPESDRTLAGVSLHHDGVLDVTTKLGRRACAVPVLNDDWTSHYYLTADGAFLRFDVSGHGVEAMTMSSEPLASGICYAPVREDLTVQTGLGLRLGDPISKIMTLYGEPDTQHQQGAATHFKYFLRDHNDRQYEWHLVFRKGHLVSWMAKLASPPLRS